MPAPQKPRPAAHPDSPARRAGSHNGAPRGRVPAGGTGPGPRRFPIVPVLLAGVLLLAVVAVVATAMAGGKDKAATVDDRPNLEQNRPVAVAGTPLPTLDETAKTDAAVGMVAPTINGQAFDGSPISITNDGSPKVVLFVAHWCPHCQREVPRLSQWLRTNQPPAGVKIYTVSTGVSANAPNFPPSAWLQREEWNPPVVADDTRSTAAKAFGLPSYPYFVVLDAHGKVVARTSGELSIQDWQSLLARATQAA